MSVADAQPTSLRHHRPFALYWVSRVSSTVALQMQAVAVAWQMYDITHNPLDLGLVGLTQFIPAALFVLVAGHVADRYDRRTIVRICQIDLRARHGDARDRHRGRLDDARSRCSPSCS